MKKTRLLSALLSLSMLLGAAGCSSAPVKQDVIVAAGENETKIINMAELKSTEDKEFEAITEENIDEILIELMDEAQKIYDSADVIVLPATSVREELRIDKKPTEPASDASELEKAEAAYKDADRHLYDLYAITTELFRNRVGKERVLSYAEVTGHEYVVHKEYSHIETEPFTEYVFSGYADKSELKEVLSNGDPQKATFMIYGDKIYACGRYHSYYTKLFHQRPDFAPEAESHRLYKEYQKLLEAKSSDAA